MPRNYTITELAQEFAVTPRTIRFYEDRGLIKPHRQGQNRIYRRGDRMRLMLILRGKRLGFSLDEISELLNLYQRRDGGLEQTARTLDGVLARIALLERQRRDIDATLGDLRDVEVQLKQTLAQLQVESSESAPSQAAQ